MLQRGEGEPASATADGELPATPGGLPATADDAPPTWQDSSLELANGVEVTDLYDAMSAEIDTPPVP